MSKRFTDSEKWKDKWFRSLCPAFKLSYIYMLDNCDHAGVIEIDSELAEFQIGCAVDWDDFYEKCGDRIEWISDSKIWLTKFICFQYGEVSRECRAHNPVFASLEKHRLLDRVSKGYPKGIQRDKDIYKDKDTDKDKDKDRTFVRDNPPTVDEIGAYIGFIGKDASEAGSIHDFYSANGWVQGNQGKPIVDWQSMVRIWFNSDLAKKKRNGNTIKEIAF